MKVDTSLFNVAAQLPKPGEKNQAASLPGFKDSLSGSIEKVNTMQLKADQAVAELASGKSNNMHETMIAVEEASIAFKLMTQVRNKVVTAYQEIIRMPV